MMNVHAALDPAEPMVEHALAYAERGWPVFPCNLNKHPLTRNGFKDASTDPTQIRAWWTQWPKAMIGVPMGRTSGVFALDPDVPEKPGEPDGFARWQALLAEHGAVHTHSHESPSGGLHVLFRWDEKRPVSNKEGLLKGSGINVRGEGGYIIVPPSQRADGRAYSIVEPLDYFHFADAPDWLYALLLPSKADPRENVVDFRADRVERYVARALEEECRTVASQASGGRNNRLNEAAFNLGTLAGAGHLSVDLIKERLLQAAIACGLVHDDGEDAVLATIESGVTAGYDHPREIPDRETRQERKQRSERNQSTKAQADEDLLTEDFAAQQFANDCAGRLRYCHTTGSWFEWTGTSWRRNETKLAFHWARLLARSLSQTELDEGRKAAIRKTSFAAGIERFCQADPVFAVTMEAWDSDPFLLGTPGGTVDLRTGQIRESRPEDGITRLTAVEPADKADCPLWLRFLDEATGSDADLIRFLQQWAGYSLTGDTREHALVFVHGSGGNGKSVFLNVFTGILKDYATTAAMDTFTASHGDKHPTDLAMLRGARLVTSSETEEGRAWAEAKIKQMTGGDPITARFMRQDFFTFRPAFKLTIVGNHKPILRNVDDAMRRRFNIVPFTRKPVSPDRQLEERLRAEWPGILRWMIDGCLDWQANGLVRPASVIDATRDYFSDQDLFGQWLEQECDAEPGNPYKTETSAALFSSWRQYAERAGERAGNQKAFAENMMRRGFENFRTKVSRGFKGIRLKVDPTYERDG